MNNYIPSGTSLFDILSMIIPGGLIIFFIADLANMTVSYTGYSYSFIFYTLFFILSYLVGLIWSSLMDWLVVGLRNNEKGINFEKQPIYKSIDTEKEWSSVSKSINLKILRDIICRKKYRDNESEDYIATYYEVVKESTGKIIIILETQVAFIRNMILVILCYGIYILSSNKFIAGLFECKSGLWIGISLIFISVFLLFVMISRQQKIYYLIWEGKKYIP